MTADGTHVNKSWWGLLLQATKNQESRYIEIGWGASTGLVSTSADASGDEAIWPGRHDVADSSRATTSKGMSAVDDRVRCEELGYADGVLNAQSAM